MIINDGKLSVIDFIKNNNNFISIKETEYNDGKGILVILNQHTDNAKKNKNLIGMVIYTISVQYQVFKAITEIPPKKDDSETEGDATDIAKPICTSDEGENKTQSTANLPSSGKDIFAQFYPSDETNRVLLE